MKRALILMTVLGLTLGGCGKTNLNPLKWLSKSRKDAQVEVYAAPVDPRGLIATVVTLEIEPLRSGVLVRATGLPPTQGFWDAALVPLPNDGSDHLVFEFRIFPPSVPAADGTQVSREITAAASVTTFDLSGITVIEVRAASSEELAHGHVHGAHGHHH
jgi:hypothetical protein